MGSREGGRGTIILIVGAVLSGVFVAAYVAPDGAAQATVLIMTAILVIILVGSTPQGRLVLWRLGGQRTDLDYASFAIRPPSEYDRMDAESLRASEPGYARPDIQARAASLRARRWRRKPKRQTKTRPRYSEHVRFCSNCGTPHAEGIPRCRMCASPLRE